jgi:hypothetical protein
MSAYRNPELAAGKREPSRGSLAGDWRLGRKSYCCNFWATARGSCRGVAPMGRGSLLEKILGVTAGSRGLGLHGEEGPCAGCLGRVRGG